MFSGGGEAQGVADAVDEVDVGVEGAAVMAHMGRGVEVMLGATWACWPPSTGPPMRCPLLVPLICLHLLIARACPLLLVALASSVAMGAVVAKVAMC